MKIIFTTEAFKKFRAYIHGIDYEISGFGKVRKEEDNLIIEDVKIFKQTVTGGNTILDAMSVAEFYDDLITAGEDPGKWKLWWHSHVWMNALFSATDHSTIDDFDSELPEENWMLSIVANKLGKLYARVDIFEPIRCTISDIPWDIEMGDISLEADVEAEIAEKVTVKYPKSNYSQTISFPPYSSLPPRKVLSDEERERLKKIFPQLPATNTSVTIQEGIILDQNGNPIPETQG